MAPWFNPSSNIEEMDWLFTEKVVALSIVIYDAKDLHAMLFAISRASPNQAASALTQLLNDN